MLQRITDLWPTLLRRAREGNDDMIEPLLGEEGDFTRLTCSPTKLDSNCTSVSTICIGLGLCQ